MITTSTRSAALAAALMLLSTAPTRAADVVPQVRLAYFPNLTHAAALVGVARNTFKDAVGSQATLDVKTFAAGPVLIEALFAGEVDIGYVGPSPAINGYVKSKGDALRVIAGASSGGAMFVVRPEANITKPTDLAGKTFATPQLGGTQDVALRYYLQQHGLKPADKGGDVTILPTQPADIFTLFRQGKIDGAWMAEPWVSRLLIEGNGKVFIDERDEWPDRKFSTTVVVARREFLEKHPALVKALLQAHVDSVQYIADDPDGAKKIVNAEIERITSKGLPPAVLDSAFRNTDILTDPLPATIQKSADYAFALGFLGAAKPDLSGLYALQPLQEVLAGPRGKKVAAR
ncbi:MAG TPA: ABC transporter substrate-binding protein [Candidatus Binatia bacterium]|jgi:NitT/TauT family transport system substrate-binding protein|nr:ABC transporter substrate-binding protein [Candidatus Binatia bacterium]